MFGGSSGYPRVRGYQWKTLFLPEGTVARAVPKGNPVPFFVPRTVPRRLRLCLFVGFAPVPLPCRSITDQLVSEWPMSDLTPCLPRVRMAALTLCRSRVSISGVPPFFAVAANIQPKFTSKC